MTAVAILVGGLLVVGIGLSIVTAGIGWGVCKRFIAPVTASDLATRRIQWYLIGAGAPLVCFAVAGSFTALVLVDDVLTGVFVTGVVGILGLGIGVAVVLPLSTFDLLGSTEYGNFRRAAISTGTHGAFVCASIPFVFTLVRTSPSEAVPLGVTATLAYFAIGPWLVDRLNDTAELPSGVADRCEQLAAAADVDVRFRLVDDDPNAFASGIIPGPRTVFVSDSLITELEPTEFEAVVVHELGHVRHRHLERRALWHAAIAAAILLTFVYSFLFVPVVFLLLYAGIIENAPTSTRPTRSPRRRRVRVR
ncbi:M48 family metallopeptidase [Natronosalvus caseinilyticus]|uniref:M48 family metallopeptidase n=1 Tax=Natronosalvus caseinilyticus TaxID=2953747 RepID=UPI0028AF506E|nr:M48 family metalloprotease [Natronosalvus caseinilyticus]